MSSMIGASGFGSDPALAASAAVAVRDSLKVQRDEKVLIVTNPGREILEIAYALFDASLSAGAKSVIMIQGVKSQIDEAEEAVISAFESQPDVVMSLSLEKLGKDREGILTPYEWDGVYYDHIFHYQLHGAKTLRAFWSPSITKRMFAETVPIDYGELGARCRRIKEVLDAASWARVTNPLGTDIRIGLRGRKAKADDGDYSLPGAGGNLPAGEVFVSPELRSSEGTIVFDGSIADTAGDIVIAQPILCRVAGGFVVDVQGGKEAAALRRALDSGESEARRLTAEGRLAPEKTETYARNARNIGELGIGLNPKAVIVGNMLEDEKAFRTCHFAIGSNYDEDAPALIHLDGLVTKPTIVAVMDGGKEVVIEKDGELLI